MQNGSAAETDVFVLTKSLPEVDKQPHCFRPINSCYSKAFCFFFILESRMQFNYSLLTGISAVLFSLAITDPVLVFRLLIEVCWACVKSGIQATPRGLCRYTWCLGAKNEKISLIIFVPSSVVAGSGCFHCPEIYSFLRKRSLVLVMNKGVAELVSLKL